MKKRMVFTLIELLVVISIIVLLIAMLIPALSKARETSRRIVCSGNLKQMGIGISMYSSDYDSYVLTQRLDSNGAGTYQYGHWWTRDGLGGYLNYEGAKVDSYATKKWQGGIYDCPTNQNGVDFGKSGCGTINYGFNTSSSGLGGPVMGTTIIPFLKAHVISPDTLVIGDTGPVINNVNGCTYFSFGVWGSYGLWGVYPLHSRGYNAVSFDGSVEYFTYYQLHTQKEQSIEPRITKERD